VDQDASTTSENPLFSDGVRQHLDLLWLLFLSHKEYLDAFRGTSIRRAKVWMLRRNAAVAVGNVGGIQEIEPLARAMREDEHPLVRGHAAWAVGQVGARIREQRLVIDLLVSVLGAEIDETVCEEIRLALSELTGGLPV